MCSSDLFVFDFGDIQTTKNEISIKRGRFGPYVTDGKKNASLKGYVVDEVTLDQLKSIVL